MFFLGMFALIALSLHEGKRFEREAGPNTPTGGGGKRVRLPMSSKVVDITTWQPPANTPMH